MVTGNVASVRKSEHGVSYAGFMNLKFEKGVNKESTAADVDLIARSGDRAIANNG